MAARPRRLSQEKNAGARQFKELDGVPILIHTLRKFASTPAVYEIIVALRQEKLPGFAPRSKSGIRRFLSKRLQIVEGGEHRQDSVASALAHIAADPQDIVLCMTQCAVGYAEIIAHVIEAAHQYGAAIAGWPAVDTVKQVERTADGALIKANDSARKHRDGPGRPGFRYNILKQAFDDAVSDGFLGTDRGFAHRARRPAGGSRDGAPRNIKITTPADMELAEFYLKTGS